MALTTGYMSASASNASALATVLDGLFASAGWTDLGTAKTAATMGTTDAVKVYVSPASTVSSNVYTGCIIMVEIDDTNDRLRFRMCERFDDAAAGSPATNVKWPAYFNTSSGAATPAADYSASTSYVASNNALVAAVNIPCSEGGFFYWAGVNADGLVLASNSGGAQNWVIAKFIGGDFMGTAGGDTAVYLNGGTLTATTSNVVGATLGTSNWNAGSASREPLSAVSTTGAFNYVMSGPVPCCFSTANYHGDFGPSTRHKFFTVTLIYAAWLHGGGSSAFGARRSNGWVMPEYAVFPHTSSLTNDGISQGDEVVAGGATWTCIGEGNVQAGTTNSDADWHSILVDGSQF